MVRVLNIHPFKHFKRLLPQSLYGRLLLIFGTPILFIVLVTGYVFVDRHWENVTRLSALHIAGDISAIADLLDRPTFTFPEVEDYARRHFNILVMKTNFRTRKGPKERPIEALERTWADHLLRKALEQSIMYPYDLYIGEDNVLLTIQHPRGPVSFLFPRKYLLGKTTSVFLMWLFGSPLVFCFIGWMFLRNQIRPIRRLARAATLFGKGRDVTDFKPEGAYEVRQAGEAFNRMRERVARQMAQRTEMLAGVSHDLRTPLTRMGLQLAMMKEGPEIAELQKDVREMTKMIEGYLAFVRGEEGEPVYKVHLKALMDDIASMFKLQADHFHLDYDKCLKIEIRPQSFKRCLVNLVENALRYASHVWISIHLEGHLWNITIDDDGPGIPANKRKDVFRPFYRLDSSRNSETGGVGLGLSIARDAIHKHGGEIHLEDSPHKGLRVRITLPA